LYCNKVCHSMFNLIIYLSYFAADMVQHRFTSMKQTFMTNLRRERESKRRCSGKSPEEIYKPK